MKSLLAIVASVFALTSFAQTAPATTKKEEAKPVATAKVTVPAKSEAKTAPTKEAKAAK